MKILEWFFVIVTSNIFLITIALPSNMLVNPNNHWEFNSLIVLYWIMSISILIYKLVDYIYQK